MGLAFACGRFANLDLSLSHSRRSQCADEADE
jgi:hypothetical protein